MLIFKDFKNFKEFNEKFGLKRKDNKYLVNKNGVAQRKNLIQYLLFKESFLYLRKCGYPLQDSYENAIKLNTTKECFLYLLDVACKGYYLKLDSFIYNEFKYLNIDSYLDKFDINLEFNSDNLSLISYNENNKVIIKKIGKFLKEKINFIFNNEILENFFIETFSEEYKAKNEVINKLILVVDTNFEKAYCRNYRTDENRDFHSCMDDEVRYSFYKSKDCFSSVRLEDEFGNVYARCNLVECYDEDNRKYYLLDRIYCNKTVYAKILFKKAYIKNIFDIYKGLTASCHDVRDIYYKDGSYFEEKLHVNYILDVDDVLSYQDTFIYYSKYHHAAYNYCSSDIDYDLDTDAEYLDINDDDE